MTNKNKVLTKDQILNKDAKLREVIFVDAPKEWGGPEAQVACMRTSAKAYDDYMQEQLDACPKDAQGNRQMSLRGLKSRLLARTIVDPETKETMFTVEELQNMTSSAIEHLWSVVGEACDLDIAKAVKRAEGNLTGGQNE